MAKKLFIFDYDGVIVNSLSMCIESINNLAEKYDFPERITKEDVEKMEYVTMDTVFSKIGVPYKEYKSRSSELMKTLMENSLKAELFNDIGTIFKMISSSGNIAAVNTANNSKAVLRRLKKSKLKNYISYIEGADSPGTKSEKIKSMMEKFSVAPDMTYMIGDTMGDITEGCKAGVITIAVTYGWQTREVLSGANPDHFCSSVKELKDLISVHIAGKEKTAQIL